MEGGYAFIDSSYPRRPGDMARMSSMEFDPTGKKYFDTRSVLIIIRAQIFMNIHIFSDMLDTKFSKFQDTNVFQVDMPDMCTSYDKNFF